MSSRIRSFKFDNVSKKISIAGQVVSDGSTSTPTVSGNLSANTQGNITSVGTLSSLVVTGNISAANYNYANGVSILAGVIANAGALSGQIVTANTALKGYIDGQITNLVNGAPATLDTLNEIANALGSDANLSVTLTSLISNVQSNVTTANTAMKGYVDAINSTLTSNLGTVSGSLATLTSNAAVQSGDIATLFANAGVQAGSLTTLTSNAAVQAGDIATLFANAGAQSASIASLNTTKANLSGATFSGPVTTTELFVTSPGGDEGGQLNLAPSATNTTLAGNVVIDVFQNRLRIFEGGGTARGGYFDLSGLSAGVGTNLAAGGGTPGGADSQIQFNNSSAFGGAASLRYFSGNGVVLANAEVASTSTATGTMQIVGGIGVAGNIFAGALYSDAHNYANGVSIITTLSTAFTTANTNLKGYTDGQITTVNSSITTANTNLKGYTDNLVTTANTNMKGYVDGQISTTTTANTNMKGYVDEQISTTSSAITTANTNLKGYTDNLVTTANTNMKGYVDGQISTTTTANTNMKGYVDEQISTTSSAITTANTNMKGYIDAINTTLTSNAATQNGQIITANTNMKGYVDGQITSLVNGAPSTLDTLNELAAALGNDANLSASLTSMIGNVQANVTTANTNMKGYVDGQISTTSSSVTTANTNMKGYVDAANTIQSNQIAGANAAIVTANTALKGYTDAAITTVTNSVTGANAAIPVYTAGITAPSSPKSNDVWYDTATDITFSYVNDGDSSQWVDITSTPLNVAVSTVTGTTLSISGAGSIGTTFSSGAHTITGSPTTAIINGGTNGVGNIGASGATFNTIFAKSTSAQYADLAEKYTSDNEYNPGTVLIFGGLQEVTISTNSHDPTVAGVVTTNPAYLMNNDIIGVAVALTGRVPCQVKGPVNKGDRLVSSSTHGTAQRLSMSEYTPGCIIGKSLETIETNEIKLIEVAIGRF
jgi:hypothetical protein